MAWPKDVRRGDLRIDYYRGSGPGGQHRNKTDSACRITHLPTELSAQAEDERSQPLNRRLAFQRLVAKLVPLMKAAARCEAAVNTADADRRIRTYHSKRGTVQDHRVPGRSFPLDSVLNGELDQIHAALLGGNMTDLT